MINLLSRNGIAFYKKPFQVFVCDSCGSTFESDQYLEIHDTNDDSVILGRGEDCPVCMQFVALVENTNEDKDTSDSG